MYPKLQIMRITRRKSCPSYEILEIMRIMKLSEHQINILNYTLFLILIKDNSNFSEFFVYYNNNYTSYSNFNAWEDIETQCAQAISSFPRIRVKNMMCACYSCALQL